MLHREFGINIKNKILVPDASFERPPPSHAPCLCSRRVLDHNVPVRTLNFLNAVLLSFPQTLVWSPFRLIELPVFIVSVKVAGQSTKLLDFTAHMCDVNKTYGDIFSALPLPNVEDVAQAN